MRQAEQGLLTILQDEQAMAQSGEEVTQLEKGEPWPLSPSGSPSSQPQSAL